MAEAQGDHISTVEELAQKILLWIERTRREDEQDTSYSKSVDRQSVLIDDIEALCKRVSTQQSRLKALAEIANIFNQAGQYD